MMTTSSNVALAGAVWGAAVGDALGVPYEFKVRDSFTCTGMMGYGTHDQPAGTWSDDTALLLATCDSIKQCGCADISDMLIRFRSWYDQGDYTPDGRVFDVGITTATSLHLGYGGTDEWSNGNGSLMRIAPLAFCGASDDEVRAASAITHAHRISTETCVQFVHMLRQAAESPRALHERLLAIFSDVPRDEVRSGGFVRDTLQASLWCFATTDSYRDCVLTAVNLGSDTDTTACVAGALAGTAYGVNAIPKEWRDALRGSTLLKDVLF